MRQAGTRSWPLILAAALTPGWCVAAATPRAPVSKVQAGPSCEACHGAHGEGQPAAHIPRLAGQSAEYLRKQLDDYASGVRGNPIMANFAKELNEKERQEAADRFAAMSAPYLPALSKPDTAPLSRGHQLAYLGDELRQVQACNSCHGPDGSGVAHAAPYLAGQSPEYIASALKSFQTDMRKNDAGQLMRSVAKRLNDSDIAAVSAYYANAGAEEAKTSSEITRHLLEKHDQSGEASKEIVTGATGFSAGSSVAYHTHPGDESAYVVKGSVVLKTKGQADRTVIAGESFFNVRGAVHSVVAGPEGATVLSTWIVDKGVPISQPIQ